MKAMQLYSRLWIPMRTLLVGLLLNAAVPAQTGGPDFFKVQLWNPDHPVDIMVYNPNHEKMVMPKPMDIPSFSEWYGKGVTEDNFPNAEKVGANIVFSVSYQDSAGEGFYDVTLGSVRRTAFIAALAIWASHIQGPATISVAASMTARGGSASSAVLASCGPESYWTDFANQPVADTWYPDAMAEIYHGSDLNADAAEIAVDFNSDVDNPTVLGARDWYYGTDSNPGSDIDFMQVTLHELCHGLGMVPSFKSDGSWGSNHGGTTIPFIYDRFLVDSSGTLLISQPVSSSNVVGNNVFWDGAIAEWAYFHDFHGTFRLPIFAPATWDGGSSISHIDEATFSNTLFELITPNYDDSFVIHDPDNIALGILQDIGHSLSSSRYVNLGASGTEDGSSGHPFNTLSEGITNVPTGGHLRLFPDSYSGAMTLTKAMTLHSCGGEAFLGTAKGVSKEALPGDSLPEPELIAPEKQE
ncbi:MAG: hypothetical protein GYA46_03360 [candidate division Zixibacteria bacterium]|nr:hypothetical protein [candidate division Zixibacteria bacterium]